MPDVIGKSTGRAQLAYLQPAQILYFKQTTDQNFCVGI